MTGRNSTYTQIQRIRRLVRLSTGNGSDSDDIFSNGSASSSDDTSCFEQVKDNFGDDEDEYDINSSEKLVNERILIEKLDFNKNLPAAWLTDIVNNEIDLDTASKSNYISIHLMFLFALDKINSEFGSLGLLLYT